MGELIAREDRVIVSSLTVVEFAVRLQRLRQQRILTAALQKRIRAKLEELLGTVPFEKADFSTEHFALAERQTQVAKAVYCKTLDRLHLAAMQGLGLKRLLTNDSVQAKAASALGFSVISPR